MATTPNTRVPVIDAHTHWYPPAWINLLLKEGEAAGAKLGRNAKGHITVAIPGLGVTLQPHYTDIAWRLEQMEKAGVAMHAVSLVQPMVYWAGRELGIKLAAVFNDAVAELHTTHPDKFIGFGTLPMQDPAAAVAEVERIARLPGMRAVYMATHINGENLDERRFWPVYEACAGLRLPMFLHPLNTLAPERMRNFYLRNFLGNPYEMGVAAASLMFSGVMDTFPKLEVVLAHAGGTFPALLGRMRHGWTTRAEVKHMARSPMEYARRFHYDPIAHDTATLMSLIRMVGADRIIGGTDFPADMALPDLIDTVEALTDLPTAERDLILNGNAVRLLDLPIPPARTP